MSDSSKLARRARKLILDLLDAPGPGGCPECHCRECLREAPHRCSITRLLDDLKAAERGGGA